MRRMLKRLRLLALSLVCLTAGPAHAEGSCARIVSLAPSVTEVLYDLGLGGSVVGRTRFCRFPREAASVPEVGGFYDMSVEAVVALRPTHIVTLKESSDIAMQAARFGAQVIEVDHSRVEGIKSSLKTIGSRCGAELMANKRLEEWRSKEDSLRHALHDSAPVKTLVVVGRLEQGGALSALYISGSDGFYTDVLKLAGGVNVNDKLTVALPVVSSEGLLALRPDAIVEIESIDDAPPEVAASAVWGAFPELPAVQNGRVFSVSDDYASIPGPRYMQLVEKIAALLHGAPAPTGGAS